MTDAPVDQTSPEAAPAPALPPAPPRRLAVDPEERPEIVLSSEPPRRTRRPRPKLRRALTLVKRACIVVVVAMASLVMLAFIVEPDAPRRTPTQGVSMRG